LRLAIQLFDVVGQTRWEGLQMSGWLAFFAVPADLTFWDIVNAPAAVTVLAVALGLWIRKDVKQAVEDATTVARLEEQAADDQLPLPPHAEDGSSAQSDILQEANERLRAQFDEKFDELERFRHVLDQQLMALSEGIQDGRYRRTFERLKGASFRVRARALYERGVLNERQYNAVLRFVQLLRARRQSSAASLSEQTREVFAQLLSVVQRG
jgi:hypothetical protein